MDNPATCPACGSRDIMFSRKRLLHICEDCEYEFAVEKEFVPHRIFVSYGHDEHANLAIRLRDDFLARGHDAWFDVERLQPGYDWEAKIEEAIDWLATGRPNSAMVLMLTPHSVRRPDGYCLNEVARALSRGVSIIPIMVVDSEPPLSICRIQWLDMRPCIPIRKKGGTYGPLFERLVQAVEEGQRSFEGTQQRLLKVLQPLPFDADILHHLSRFIGREWVFDAIDAWLAETPPKQRVFWICGGPGVGKSAISAMLGAKRLEIAAIHFCKFGHSQKSTARNVVTSIAYQLSTQLTAYEATLAAQDFDAVAGENDARTLFDNLIVQPLTKLPRPSREIVILIDALDEATSSGGYNALAGFIASEFPKTPDWLRLIITSRPEDAVKGPLQGLDPFFFDTDIESNREDIRAYLRRELAEELIQYTDAGPIVEAIVRLSQGVFLYIERICTDVRAGHLSLNNLGEFPQGLGGVYWQFFERLVWDTRLDLPAPDFERYRRDFRPALRAILAAREPLPVVILQELFRWEDESLRDFTRALGSLFPVSHQGERDTIEPWHKTLAEWLDNEAKSGEFYVSAGEGHRLLAEAGRRQFDCGVEIIDSYFLTHFPSHLAIAGRWDDLETVLTDLPFLEAKIFAGLTFELPEDFRRAVEALPIARPQRRILERLDEAIRRDIHFIARHAEDYPQALFQCVWNHGWYYDCPAAAMHYEAPQGGWQQQPPWELSGLKLHRLLERWRAEREALHEVGCWLRSHRPPPVPLASSLKAVLCGHEDSVFCVAFSPDGRCIVSGSMDKNVRLWDATSGAELVVMRGHEGEVRSVVFSPDGSRLVSGSQDNTVRLWDKASGEELAVLRGHTWAVTSVAFSPDGERIVSGSRDNTVRLWDVASGMELNVLRGHEDSVTSVAFSSNGEHIVSGSQDKTVRIWNAASGAEVNVLRRHEGRVWCVAFSPDGNRIVSGSRDNTVRLWSVDSGAELAVLRGHEDSIASVAFSPEGDRIVSGSFDKTVRLWDAASGAELAVLCGHEDYVYSVACSPNSSHIVSGSSDNTVRLWDAASGVELSVLRGHEGRVWSVAFSPDGECIVSGSFDKTVRLWAAASGMELAVLCGHEWAVTSVAFCPDGEHIISESWDKTVRLWDARGGECIEVGLKTGDVSDIAAELETYPYKVILHCGETVIEDISTGRSIVRFPEELGAFVTHPNTRIWAGARMNHLYIFTLEGGEGLFPQNPMCSRDNNQVGRNIDEE